MIHQTLTRAIAHSGGRVCHLVVHLFSERKNSDGMLISFCSGLFNDAISIFRYLEGRKTKEQNTAVNYLLRRFIICTRYLRVRFSAGASTFFLRHRIWTGSGAHSASYPMGIGDSLSGG
jgi:hypothetical protein